MATKTFFELDSFMFAACTACEHDMNCSKDERADCPIL